MIDWFRKFFRKPKANEKVDYVFGQGIDRFKVITNFLKDDEDVTVYNDKFYHCLEVTVVKAGRRKSFDIQYKELFEISHDAFIDAVIPRFEKVLKELRGEIDE